MRKTLQTLLGMGAFAAANAVPVTFTDIVNPADVLMVKGGSNETYSYLHDILDNGFAPVKDLITGAEIFITLADDGDRPAENVRISLDNLVVAASRQVTAGNFQFLVNSELLQADGRLSVTLKALAGDFYFQSSRLEVAAESPEAVPEPTTVALMGMGLLGLGAAFRRKKS